MFMYIYHHIISYVRNSLVEPFANGIIAAIKSNQKVNLH